MRRSRRTCGTRPPSSAGGSTTSGGKGTTHVATAPSAPVNTTSAAPGCTVTAPCRAPNPANHAAKRSGSTSTQRPPPDAAVTFTGRRCLGARCGAFGMSGWGPGIGAYRMSGWGPGIGADRLSGWGPGIGAYRMSGLGPGIEPTGGQNPDKPTADRPPRDSPRARCGADRLSGWGPGIGAYQMSGSGPGIGAHRMSGLGPGLKPTGGQNPDKTHRRSPTPRLRTASSMRCVPAHRIRFMPPACRTRHPRQRSCRQPAVRGTQGSSRHPARDLRPCAPAPQASSLRSGRIAGPG